jgi:hypothetical protein
MIDEGKTPDKITDYIMMLKHREEAKDNKPTVDLCSLRIGICAVYMYSSALHGEAFITLGFMLNSRMFAIRS